MKSTESGSSWCLGFLVLGAQGEDDEGNLNASVGGCFFLYS